MVFQRLGILESRWVTVNGLPVHARVSVDSVPDGYPAVVLVHGVGISSRYMVPTAERLAPYFRVYAPDLPGFGRSAKPSHVLNLTELADALDGWMQAVGLERAVLLGNSFGCQIIVELALRHPERVERAVLQGPTVDPKARTALQQIARWQLNTPREPPSLGVVTIRDYRECGIRRVVRTFQHSLHDRIEEKLPHMQTPTLIVRGGRDPIVPQRWAEEATRLLPKGRLIVIPGAAHTVNYNSPLELARVVRSFLSGDQPRDKEDQKEGA
jgi:2-hydroxy-6-oxonona-2,4-dienedioate hydrolase